MIHVLKMLTSSVVTASKCKADSNCEFSARHPNDLSIGLYADISVFTCLCPFVPGKINSSAAPELCNDSVMGKHYMIPDAIRCMLPYEV